ncbi:aminotransferase class IV [Limibaculum sp. M0105]|uniref:Probable branched-chain-amino-acid aminotransferase n=1 Tax=Thermohalobaculum xanthum TaxID=2753746 RepID=A0A8J7M6X5_9RHOB|nr:aminotransferase class IV [Thermohalobaculum xanthum]MBK0398835.1 aminotransferase class IV [Thermohalobaculum xanthum]
MHDWSKGAAIIRGEIVPIAEARIGVTDWGMTRSDITYDVAPVLEGAFFRLPDYLARFAASRAALRLSIPEDDAAIRATLHAIVARAGLRNAYVAMVASRGAPAVPGSRDPRDCVNHFYAWCVPYLRVISAEVEARGARIWIARQTHRIPEDSINPRVKNYHWGDFTQALFEAYDHGADTAVLTDHAGNIAEGPGFNVFCVSGGRLITPRGHCLEGITRQTVLDAAAEAGVAAEVRDIPLAEFLDADEVFTATTAGGPVPVVRVDDRILGNGAPGPVSEMLRERYWQMTRRAALRDPVVYA